jgi:HTH-type transcriptional regulator / antitoxin HipB
MSMTPSSLFGRALHFHRKRAGLSRRELSVLADVSQTSIYDVEHGKKTVRMDTVARLCAALNIRMRLESPLMDEFLEGVVT